MKKTVSICVLDTGIYAKHMDFDNRVTGFYDFVSGRPYAYDDSGHGTHVSGICAGSGRASKGKYKGVAYNSNIVALKVLDSKGNGALENVIAGLEWILNNHKTYNIRVVNISFGTQVKNDDMDRELLEKVDKVWDSGIVVVAAAGNDGPGNGTVTVPGTNRKIITVGSSDDEYIRSEHKNYSGRGPTRECIVKPEILAPGNNIMSCGLYKNGYTRKSGTSMSAPYVSGAVALLLTKYPDMTPLEVKLKLHDTARSLNMPKSKQGWGIINLEKFLI